ncbi:MAG TPA: bactofilin [Bacilli bacterium]
MGQAKSRNLVISGIGSFNGGQVETAKIDGIGKINGDLGCFRLILNGKAEIHGNAKAASADINGVLSVEGDMQSGNLNVHGKVVVAGGCTADDIQLDGIMSVKGDCEAEKFAARGKLQMKTLNAGLIEIHMHGHCQIAEIGGEQIRIRKLPGVDFARWLKMVPLQFGNRLTAEIIEGDDVYVEHTKAAVVRGANVVIGPGSEIGLVEYKQKFEQDKSAKVMRTEQM